MVQIAPTFNVNGLILKMICQLNQNEKIVRITLCQRCVFPRGSMKISGCP